LTRSDIDLNDRKAQQRLPQLTKEQQEFLIELIGQDKKPSADILELFPGRMKGYLWAHFTMLNAST